MKMEKRQFRIGQLAQLLQVEQFVIRFWEKEFGLPTRRSSGGQRFYSEKDFQLFKTIKSLLYEGGFTIAGAKKQLAHKSNTTSMHTASYKISHSPLKNKTSTSDSQQKQLEDQLIVLHNQLMKLRSLL